MLIAALIASHSHNKVLPKKRRENASSGTIHSPFREMTPLAPSLLQSLQLSTSTFCYGVSDWFSSARTDYTLLKLRLSQSAHKCKVSGIHLYNP